MQLITDGIGSMPDSFSSRAGRIICDRAELVCTLRQDVAIWLGWLVIPPFSVFKTFSFYSKLQARGSFHVIKIVRDGSSAFLLTIIIIVEVTTATE